MARDDVKRDILAKARELILLQGSFTIKELTDQTHINIAAVNYHFGSKDNLTRIIVQDLLSDFKRELSFYIMKLEHGVNIEQFIEELVTIIYDFTVENIALLRYFFMTIDNKNMTSSLIYEAFFKENEFTRVVYHHLAHLIGSDNPKEISARYMIFFASSVAPMIFELIQKKEDVVTTFRDQEFKNFYITQMIKLLS